VRESNDSKPLPLRSPRVRRLPDLLLKQICPLDFPWKYRDKFPDSQGSSVNFHSVPYSPNLRPMSLPKFWDGGLRFPPAVLGLYVFIVAPSDFISGVKPNSQASSIRVGDRAASLHGARRVERRRTERTTASFSTVILFSDSITPVASRPVGMGTDRHRVLVSSGLPLASF
jgi:hypothetical protein